MDRDDPELVKYAVNYVTSHCTCEIEVGMGSLCPFCRSQIKSREPEVEPPKSKSVPAIQNIEIVEEVISLVNEVKSGQDVICLNCHKDSFKFRTGKYGDFVYCPTCKCTMSGSSALRKLKNDLFGTTQPSRINYGCDTGGFLTPDLDDADPTDSHHLMYGS
jgi:hypothetical protein